MSYFFVLPLFALWLIVAVVAVMLARKRPRLQPAYPYVVRICAWATIGIVLANIVLVLALVFSGAQLPERPIDFIDKAVVLVWGIALLLGPMLATVTGWFSGAILGVCLAVFHQHTQPP